MTQSFYCSYEGFKYLLNKKPLRGAYVAMENFGRGLLEYGHFDQYHSYFAHERRDMQTGGRQKARLPRHENMELLSWLALLNEPEIPYRILHFEEFRPQAEVVFRKYFRKKNIPVTRTVYTIATSAHLRSFLDLCLFGGGGRPYDSIVVPSRAAQTAVRSYYSDLSRLSRGRAFYRGRVDVIPYGIDVRCFKPGDKPLSRQKLGLPQEDIIFLSLGRLSSVTKMNYERLLLFFSGLNRSAKRNISYLVAGAGDRQEAEELEALGESLGLGTRLSVLANLDETDKIHALNAADIFVSLSDNLQESFGIALIEAMAAGLPVLCSDWDGYKDLVTDGVSGFRIPTTWSVRRPAADSIAALRAPYDHSVIFSHSQELQFDNEMLLSRASELISNDSLRQAFGDNARLEAGRRFSLQTVMSQYEALWAELHMQAEKDHSDYDDLAAALYYDFARQFACYPTRVVDAG